MKKTLLSIILILGAVLDTAAQFKETGMSADELYTGQNKISTAEGDLNKDGTKDLVISDQNSFAIYFGGQSYRLYGSYNYVKPEKQVSKEFGISITSKGVLRIEAKYAEENVAEAGIVYMLRWQDEGFYLIGGKFSFQQNGEFVALSLNMLTNKVIVHDQNNNPVSDPIDMPKLPLKNLSDIKVGHYEDFEDYLKMFTSNHQPQCDMEALWDAVAGDDSGIRPEIIPEENLAFYQLGEHVYRERFVKAFPVGADIYIVFDTYTCVVGMNEADFEGETHYVKEYVYQNGQLIETELQEELKPYAEKYATVFTQDVIQFLNGTETEKQFRWDGGKFVGE